MGLKVLNIKGLGKISVIYASFCAPYLPLSLIRQNIFMIRLQI